MKVDERINAAKMLSAVKSDKAIPALLSIIRNKPPIISLDRQVFAAHGCSSTTVIGQILNASDPFGKAIISMGVQALPFLIEMLSDNDPKIRMYSVWAIGEIRVKNDKIERAICLAAEDINPYVRYFAIKAKIALSLQSGDQEGSVSNSLALMAIAVLE